MIGLLLAAVYAVMFHNGGRLPFFPARAQTPLSMPTSFYLYGSLQSVALLVLSVTLMAFCIRALSLRESARRHAMTWSLVLIGWWFASCIAATLMTHVATTHMTKHAAPGSKRVANSGSIVINYRPGGIVLNWILNFVVLCWPAVLFLVLWRRPHVIAAFQGNRAASAAEPEALRSNRVVSLEAGPTNLDSF